VYVLVARVAANDGKGTSHPPLCVRYSTYKDEVFSKRTQRPDPRV
jgi:hypothetical protein